MLSPSALSGIPKGPLPSPPPSWIVRIVIALRFFLIRLADLILPPELVVLERSTGVAYTAAIAELYRGGYAELLDAEPMSAAEIAARTGRDADATFRLLHLFAGIGFVTLSADGRFGTTPRLQALKKDHPSRVGAFVQYFASKSNVDAWFDLGRTLDTGKNAFQRVHGKVVWDYFDDHPDERETFAHAMMGMTFGDAPFIATAYPFGEVQTVCDVGGGRGSLLSEVLLRHPKLRGILAEGAGVLESAKSLLAHRGVAERVDLVVANFFENIPEGADLYMMKNILHDWDDAACHKILGAVRRAMKPGQRVLIVEAFLDRTRPDPVNTPSDMQMMLMCAEGRERSLEELRGLLRDNGFTPARAWPLPTIGLLEGIAA
jgi:hypothetical protein